MPISRTHSGRLKAVLALVAAAGLTAAGLAFLSTPTEAAPSAAAPLKKGYTGAPVNPAPYTLTQPDGSTIEVRRFGDALSNGVATVKGNHTLVQGNDDYWRYAAGLKASGALKPSAVIAGQGTAPRASKNLAPAPTAKATQAETPKAGVGDDDELVILVSFADQDAVGSDQDDWASRYFGASDSVDDFYDEASGGQFGLTPAADTSGASNGVVGWLELPYDHPNTGVENNSEDYIADAIEAADPFVDYASFDTDGDGEIDTDELHVTVIGAGYETAYSGPGNTCEDGPSIWGHQWDLANAQVPAPVVDDVTVGDLGYTTFGEWHCAANEVADPDGHMATIGIMAHEFGHDINWPDLYDVDGSSEGIGEFSLMSGGSWGETGGAGSLAGNSPSHPDAWALWYQNWVTPTSVLTPTNDVQVAAGTSVLVSPNPGGVDWLFGENSGQGEYFLIENRQPVGYDVSIPGCGLVAYRIDERVTSSNGANSDEDDPLVKVLEADGLNQMYNNVNRGDAGDPYPGSSGNHELDNASNPSTKFDDGTPSNLDVHIDSNTCASTMQLDVVAPGIVSPPPTPPANDNYSAATVVSGGSGTVTQSTKYATEEAGEPEPAGVGAASVWFKWTAPASGNLTVNTLGSDFDTTLGLYTGSAVNALTELASNDDFPGAGVTSRVTAHVTAGTVYSIDGAGWDGDTGSLTMGWNLVADPTTPTPTVVPTVTPTVIPTPTVTPTVVPAPENDMFASPTKLKGKDGKEKGTSEGATTEAKEKVFKAGKGGASSVWFTFKAKKDGKLTIKASGDFAPLLAVAKGTKLSKLDVLESDTSGAKAEVTVKVKEGKTYRIVLDGKHGGSGAYKLTWKWKSAN